MTTHFSISAYKISWTDYQVAESDTTEPLTLSYFSVFTSFYHEVAYLLLDSLSYVLEYFLIC